MSSNFKILAKIRTIIILTILGIVFISSTKLVIAEPDNGVWDIALSPDGNYLAIGRNNHRVTIFDYNNLQEILEIGTAYTFSTIEHTPIDFSSDGTLFASGHHGNITIWDTSEWQKMVELGTFNSDMRDVVFSPDGKIIAGVANQLTLWNITQNYLPFSIEGYCNCAIGGFTPDSNRLVIIRGGAKDAVEPNIYDTNNLSVIDHLKGHNSSIRAMAMSQTENITVTTDFSQNVIIWNPVTLEIIEIIKNLSDKSIHVAISPDNNLIALNGFGDDIVIYDLVENTIRGNITHSNEEISTFEFSNDNKYLIYGTWDGTIAKVDLTSFEEVTFIQKASGISFIYVGFSIILITVLRMKRH